MPTWRSVGRIASEKVCDLRLRRQRCMCHGWSHRCWAGHALRCYHRGLISRIALFGSNFLDRPVPISEVQKVRNHFHSDVWLQPFVCLQNQCANRPCLRHSFLTMVIVTRFEFDGNRVFATIVSLIAALPVVQTIGTARFV